MERCCVKTHESIVENWLAAGGRPHSDAELRLVRRLPHVQSAIDGVVRDPVERALAGLSDPPPVEGDLPRRIRISVARADASMGNDAATMMALEAEAEASGEAHLWITAARLHSQESISREAEARMALSAQTLPYVFPGEIDPLMVHMLAAGERILPALHVDWIRKLTVWLAPALTLDFRAGGLWFWPVLRSLDSAKLARPLAEQAKTRHSEGSLGLAAAYSRRVGLADEPLLAAGGERDRVVAALAVLGDASR